MEALSAELHGKPELPADLGVDLGDGTVLLESLGDSTGSKAALPALGDSLGSTGHNNPAASEGSVATQAATDLLNDATDDVQSTMAAFGSPHVGSPLPPAPPSPADLPAKQLDFDLGKPAASPVSPVYPPASTPVPSAPTAVTAAAPKPPATPVTPASVPFPAAAAAGFTSGGENAEGAIDYDTFVRETVLWTNKVRSVVYLVGGLGAIWGLRALLNTKMSIITGVFYALLASCAWNSFRGFVTPNIQARSTWQNSAWTNRLQDTFTSIVKGAAELHDKHINAADGTKMLRLVLVFWAITLAGRVVGTMGLVSTLWVLAFVLPKAYTVYRTQVDKVVCDVTTQVKTQFLNLDAKVRAALVVVPIFVAGYLLSYTDLAVAAFAVILYAHSWLKPNQVERLNQAVVGPLNTAVTKVGGAVSHVVSQTATKFDLTPTPAKLKRA